MNTAYVLLLYMIGNLDKAGDDRHGAALSSNIESLQRMNSRLP